MQSPLCELAKLNDRIKVSKPGAMPLEEAPFGQAKYNRRCMRFEKITTRLRSGL